MNDQEATKKLLVALRHPIRREILMTMHRLDKPMSPRGLSTELKMPLSNVSYHARVLVDCDVLRLVDLQPVRGSIQHFYETSDLMEHPVAKAALGLEGDSDAASGT